MKYSKSDLTPAKKKFAQVFSETDNATEAVRQAYPLLAQTSSDKYLTLKGNRLISNDSVSAEIEQRRQVMAINANKAAKRIQGLIDSDKEEIALKASIFSYEQEEGRAVQHVQQSTTGITINLDLTSALSTEK